MSVFNITTFLYNICEFLFEMGFLPVKTWVLIVSGTGTAFYAIIYGP